jgi:hypothetical protein
MPKDTDDGLAWNKFVIILAEFTDSLDPSILALMLSFFLQQTD